MSLTLNQVARNPEKYRFNLVTLSGEKLVHRPLLPEDEKALINLIQKLSAKTKKFYLYKDPPEIIAKEVCNAINKYDKLRFVLELTNTKELIGLFEFSFDIPEDDKNRFINYGITLSANDCRFGPLIRDDHQSKRIGSLVFPSIIDIAKQFNKKRIILWGGVNDDNFQAIRFYEKNKFKNVGTFIDKQKAKCFDMILEI